MAIILARYSEIGLKSTPVRIRFENRLRDNILSMFATDRIEAAVTKKDARYFIETEDVEGAVASLKRVFGIASVSVAETCTSDMEDIKRTAAEYSRGKIPEGQSFAVKARREGSKHGYSSMDVGREAGSAIFEANPGVRVDLTNPDHVFYIEVRNNAAYIFGSYVRCHAGLPVGTQGRVISDADDDRGLVSAWLMMKRGCRVYMRGKADVSLLRRYDPGLKVLAEGEEPTKKILGLVRGSSVRDVEEVDVTEYEVPVYFPTVGMTDEEVRHVIDVMKDEA
ncbi:MAG: THUMP domain-containing protein [Candidatus Methanoplasma sp.]|nr:THUMP domain-containing protein [Candidatus Methanoplasma sp.]